MIELKVLPWARGAEKVASPTGGEAARAIIRANGPQIVELSKQMLLQHHGVRSGDPDAGLTMTIEFRLGLWEKIV